MENHRETYLRHLCVPPLHRNILFRILRDVMDVLKKHRVEHWGVAGTLLGAVRDETLIHHDDDLDLGVWESDRAKIEGEVKSELESMGYLCHPTIMFKVIVPGLHMRGKVRTIGTPCCDLFYHTGRTGIVRLEMKKLRLRWPRWKWPIVYPLVQKKFGPLYLPVPEKSDHYLGKMYPGWKSKCVIDIRLFGDKSQKTSVPIDVMKRWISSVDWNECVWEGSLDQKKIKAEKLN